MRTELGSIYTVDKRTRAVMHAFDLALPLGVARKLLVRPPVVDRTDLVSWGNMSAEEIERLMRAEQDFKEEDIEILTSLCADRGVVEAFWSLSYQDP